MDKQKVDALVERVEALETREALRQLMYQYGISMDVLYMQTYRSGPQIARAESLAAFKKCFADEAAVDVVLFGNSAQPLYDGDSLEGWVDFLIGFSAQSKMSSARHLVSNIDIKMTSDSTADLTASSLTAHFQASSSTVPEPSNPFFSGNYTAKAKKVAGLWKVVKFTVNVDDAQNIVGVYNLGCHPGVAAAA